MLPHTVSRSFQVSFKPEVTQACADCRGASYRAADRKAKKLDSGPSTCALHAPVEYSLEFNGVCYRACDAKDDEIVSWPASAKLGAKPLETGLSCAAHNPRGFAAQVNWAAAKLRDLLIDGVAERWATENVVSAEHLPHLRDQTTTNIAALGPADPLVRDILQAAAKKHDAKKTGSRLRRAP